MWWVYSRKKQIEFFIAEKEKQTALEDIIKDLMGIDMKRVMWMIVERTLS